MLHAAAAAEQRDAASWAAAIGAIRGDLWAESAFTYADLLWGDKEAFKDEACQTWHVRGQVSITHSTMHPTVPACGCYSLGYPHIIRR